MRNAVKLRLPVVELRIPSLRDAETLVRLGIETFSETFARCYPEADLQQFLATTYNRRRMEEELSDPTNLHLVAYCDGIPAGFMKARDCMLPLPAARRPQMELQRIYVKKAFQGFGVGKALMDAAIGGMHAKGAQEICLGVWENNARALDFYADYGFEKAGQYDFHIGSQVDREWILRKIA